MVIRNHERLLARPVVRLVLDRSGTPCDPDELDLSERASENAYRHAVVRSMDPHEIGVDMLTLIVSGQVEPAPEDPDGHGLVHEPAHGEEQPPGYVDTHSHAAPHDADLVRVDPEVSAPFGA
jgi:hypothetical protein